MPDTQNGGAKIGYNRFLLLVAGLGGLLFGVDIGIISGALPYLQDTSKITADQSSYIVAAVQLGGVFSTLLAGFLGDLFGRKPMMIVSGLLFAVSIPVIALSQSYEALLFGRILQGLSGGLIGVIIPLYLAECLTASERGRGTAVFQWLLTLGFVVAALIAWYFSAQVDAVVKTGDAAQIFAVKDGAWRRIFWVSLPPGILFVIGSFMVAESPRWLFRRNRKEAALKSLLRSRGAEQARLELQEMQTLADEERAAVDKQTHDSLFQRKYILPFVIACIILACNQATGVNSIIGYNAMILIQAGLNDVQAHLGYVLLTIVNFLTTFGAVALVDRKGRKFLLSLGSAGVIVSLFATGLLFHKNESQRVDVRDAVQTMVVSSNQTVSVQFNATTAQQLLASRDSGLLNPSNAQTLVIIYSYGDFHAATKVIRSVDPGAALALDRASCVPDNKVSAFLKNPFADYAAAKTAPLRIENALITPVPSPRNGWLTAVLLYCFMASFAIGPGVCVWLALSELMPTRIRSNGMSIALLINIAISTGIAGVFLPTVGKYGYNAMFFLFAGCTVIYFVTATFFLPETKGKTLEEIEAHFEGKK